MAKVPRIIKVPEGEAYVETENPLGAMGYYVVSKGDLGAVPGEDPLGLVQQHLDRAVGAPGRLRARRHHHPRQPLLHPGGHRPMTLLLARRSTSPYWQSTVIKVLGHHASWSRPGADPRLRLPVQDHELHAEPPRPDGGRPPRLPPAPRRRRASSSRRRTSSPNGADMFIFKAAPLVVLISTFLLFVVMPASARPRRRGPRRRRLLRAGRVVALGHRRAHGRLGVGQQVRPHRWPPGRRPAHRLRAARWCSPSSAWSSRPARMSLQGIVFAQADGDDLRLERHRQPVHPHPVRRVRDLHRRRAGRAHPDAVRHAGRRVRDRRPATRSSTPASGSSSSSSAEFATAFAFAGIASILFLGGWAVPWLEHRQRLVLRARPGRALRQGDGRVVHHLLGPLHATPASVRTSSRASPGSSSSRSALANIVVTAVLKVVF